MTDIKGFTLQRSTLRALFHAQSAMVTAHSRTLLFYAAEVINAAKPHLDENQYPDAIKSAEALAHLKDNPYNLHSLMGFQINGTLAAALDILAGIKNADLGEGNEDLQKLVAKTHDYIDMARRIQTPDYEGSLVHMSKLDPVLAAEFISLYMAEFVTSNAPLATHLDGNPLTKSKQRLYEIGEANKEYISILMDDISDEADYCRKIASKLMGMDEYEPDMYRLYSLFQSCAIFDWRQYEENGPAKDMPKATVLEFKPPKASNG